MLDVTKRHDGTESIEQPPGRLWEICISPSAAVLLQKFMNFWPCTLWRQYRHHKKFLSSTKRFILRTLPLIHHSHLFFFPWDHIIPVTNLSHLNPISFSVMVMTPKSVCRPTHLTWNAISPGLWFSFEQLGALTVRGYTRSSVANKPAAMPEAWIVQPARVNVSYSCLPVSNRYSKLSFGRAHNGGKMVSSNYFHVSWNYFPVARSSL